jgi:alkaline phosphatase
MVADGSGWNAWNATAMYQGKLGSEIYDGPDWVKMACSTYPLNQATKPKGKNVQDKTLVYDQTKAWATAVVPVPAAKKTADADEDEDDAKAAVAKNTFAGYLWLKGTYTDSAAAATALATGTKTYNNAINWTDANKPLRGQTIPEIAKAAGKSVGAITTVQWSHATPAGLGGAHNVSRNNYAQIAREMLDAPYLDVIMGAGHPDYDANGTFRTTKQDYKYVGGTTPWLLLKSAQYPVAWKLVESKADFEALTDGPTPPKVLGVAQVAGTLQQGRFKVVAATETTTTTADKSAAAGSATKTPAKPLPPEKPYERPLNANVPSLATMTKAAINCLDDNPQGFYLMIEGGAVDWANHSGQSGRMVEEQIDYLKAVEAVVAWVEKHSSWDDTLLILTADHETGLIWGPDSDKTAFDPIVDRGAGKVPGMKYNSAGHSSTLVPLFARGAGSRQFAKLVVGTDKTAAAKFGFSGQYVENTSVFRVMKDAVTAK